MHAMQAQAAATWARRGARLVRESAVLVAGLQQLAPDGVEALVVPREQRPVLLAHLPRRPAAQAQLRTAERPAAGCASADAGSARGAGPLAQGLSPTIDNNITQAGCMLGGLLKSVHTWHFSVSDLPYSI